MCPFIIQSLEFSFTSRFTLYIFFLIKYCIYYHKIYFFFKNQMFYQFGMGNFFFYIFSRHTVFLNFVVNISSSSSSAFFSFHKKEYFPLTICFFSYLSSKFSSIYIYRITSLITWGKKVGTLKEIGILNCQRLELTNYFWKKISFSISQFCENIE